ncbi:TRAP transporter small permease [Falsiroseomonas sp.]|uniref:TRAP transporter small permease n=1 Tax=Falsiroseomonas sp. TaxID=2870721 RepID=UPI003568FA75
MSVLLRLIDRIETFGMVFFFSAALVVGTAQVVARYGFNTGVVWSEQAFVYFTIWAALIGASRAVRDGLHVRVDVLVNSLGARWRRPLEIFGLLVNLVFCAVLLYAAIGYTDFLIMVGTRNVDSGVPEWVTYLVTPLFLALMCVRYLALLPVTIRSPSGDPWHAAAGTEPGMPRPPAH